MGVNCDLCAWQALAPVTETSARDVPSPQGLRSVESRPASVPGLRTSGLHADLPAAHAVGAEPHSRPDRAVAAAQKYESDLVIAPASAQLYS